MKKIILASVLSLVLLVTFGLAAKAEMAKEGTYSGTEYICGTYKVFPMGEERFYLSYEFMGVVVSDTGKGFMHNMSIQASGSLHAVKGMVEQERGITVYTDPDGDKVFLTWKGTEGKLGEYTKGIGTFVGGTGKYTGVTGDQKYTYTELHPAAEGTFQGIVKIKGNYKLP
jgi:hypothetical protein